MFQELDKVAELAPEATRWTALSTVFYGVLCGHAGQEGGDCRSGREHHGS